VPDFDIDYGLGDRVQLKYEIPIAIEETRPQPADRLGWAAGFAFSELCIYNFV